MQNFFLLCLGPQKLNSAFLRGSLLPTFLQNIENLNLWVFRSQDRYFYCKANFAAFLSTLLEHIGNRMQNFFSLFLGRQILNSAFHKGSFLPAFLQNIEHLNLWVFRSHDRYFYCKANFAAFLSKLLEHIGNRMQNFFCFVFRPSNIELGLP